MLQMLSPKEKQDMATQLMFANAEINECHQELEIKMKIIEELRESNKELLAINKILKKKVESHH